MTYRPSRYEVQKINEAIELMEPDTADELIEVIADALYDLWFDVDYHTAVATATHLADQFNPELA